MCCDGAKHKPIYLVEQITSKWLACRGLGVNFSVFTPCEI